MENLALVFPGQGSQHTGMGAGLFKESNSAKLVFEEASDTLRRDMRKLCFEGSLLELSRLEIMFTAIITAGVASFRAFQEQTGLEVKAMAGHSLGEYTALTCSGALRFDDALRIAQIRGRLSQRVVDDELGSMTIVDGISVEKAQEICSHSSSNEHIVSIAAYNSRKQVAICGNPQRLEQVEEEFVKVGASVTPLFFSPPFHSPIMECIVNDLQEELKRIKFQPFKIPVIANVNAQQYPSENDISRLLCMQITKPVKWTQTLDYFINQEIYTVIDMGPQSILTNLIKQYEPKLSVISYSQKEERAILKKSVPQKASNANMQFGNTVYNTITKCMSMAVSTRNQNDNEEEYNKGVVKPYEDMVKIQDEIDLEQREPSLEEKKTALRALKTIFITKKVPIDEQNRRFEQIFIEMNEEEHSLCIDYLNNFMNV